MWVVYLEFECAAQALFLFSSVPLSFGWKAFIGSYILHKKMVSQMDKKKHNKTNAFGR